MVAGECETVTLTFEAAGLEPDDYYASLEIESNDPDSPAVAVLVTMTLLAQPVGAGFSWTPPDPVVGDPVTFAASVGGGGEPLTYH